MVQNAECEVFSRIHQWHLQQRPHDSYTTLWDCVLETGIYEAERDTKQNQWADAAYRGDWDALFEVALGNGWDMGLYANSTRLRPPSNEDKKADRPSGYTALHQAAWHGAPVQVVQGLIELGASRNIKSMDGKKQRPIDVAQEKGYQHLYGILSPVRRLNVSDEVLSKVETHFHAVIVKEAGGLFKPDSMRLPDVGILHDDTRVSMQIPGMYGGFVFWWEEDHLVTESLCRVVGGSGRTNHITADGAKLFVMDGMRRLEYLTKGQVEKFNEDGYLVIPNFLTPGEVDALLNRTKQLLDEFDLASHPLTRFTTDDDSHVGDDYFLSSGDKIRYFLEVDAVDGKGKLTRDKTQSVNKIGHALHELDPAFRKVTLENERLRQVVRDLRFHRDPVALQSMIIMKQPEIGGAVPEHNDSTFLYTNPPSALGFWIALEQCTESNGALSFLPGSHLTTPITRRFVRMPGGRTGFEELQTSSDASQQPPKSMERYVQAPCAPGDLVLIHGSVLHKSARNTSQNTRFAYTFHMIESAPYAEYDEKNWLQPTEAMPFSRVLESCVPLSNRA